MPEVFVDDPNAPDTSTTSTEAVDGDVSNDSIGGRVVAQWRDIFLTRNRREVDLVVAKKLNRGPQLPLLVVEIKRGVLDSKRNAMDQIEDYLDRILSRCAALGYNHPVYGLLIFGPVSFRIVSTLNAEGEPVHTYLDTNRRGSAQFVDTDSKIINEWLIQQSLAFLNYQ